MDSDPSVLTTVRFRTLIAHEWTENTTVTHRRGRSELARDLRYRSVEGK